MGNVQEMHVTPEDRALVEELLGRKPQGSFEVVVRHDDGTPRVIRNAPILDDGTPMPTLFWLVSAHDRLVVSRLESTQAITQVQSEISLDVIGECHDAYEAQRDSLMPPNHTGPRPSGGVGGTRRGVKCLHAHYAYYLTGAADPVGAWVADRLAEPVTPEPVTPEPVIPEPVTPEQADSERANDDDEL